jgi:hypothetical protein
MKNSRPTVRCIYRRVNVCVEEKDFAFAVYNLPAIGGNITTPRTSFVVAPTIRRISFKWIAAPKPAPPEKITETGDSF